MRAATLLQTVVLLSLVAVPAAWAGPITGQPPASMASTEAPGNDNASPGNGNADDEERRRVSASFDAGSLFDVIGTPLLRVSAPVYMRLAVSSPSVDSVAEVSAGGDLPSFSSAPSVGEAVGDAVAAVGNVLPDVTNLIDIAAAPAAVPEPASLLLLVPAVFLIRRRFVASQRLT